jgi:hypothetical protein
MSLINLLNEQQKDKEVSNIKNTGRTVIGAAAVAGTAYLLNENVNLTSGVKKSLGALKNSSASQNELGRAGSIIRKDAERLKSVVNESRKVALKTFKEEILSSENLERMFNETSSANEARAFLSALFDTASESMIDDSGSLKASLEKLYQGVETGNIEQVDMRTAIDFYKSSVSTSGPKLQEFKKRHSSMMKTKGQFNTTFKDFTTEGTSTVEWKSASTSDLSRKATKKYGELKSMASGKNIQLVSLEEYGPGEGKSTYARVEHSSGRFQNVALDLAKDPRSGMTIIRGTENMSTRYTTSGGVIDAAKIFPSLDLNQLATPKGTGAAAALKDATMSLEDHLFGLIKENKQSFQNFSVTNINEYNDYIRSMSIETPRTMIEGLNSSRTINGGKEINLIDKDLMSTLIDSRAFQSSIHRIAGLEKFAQKDREQVTKKILQYESEIYGGTSGSQTLTSRFKDPFDLKREMIVGHIERLENDSGTKTKTAFNAMKRYGRLDRSLVPQTARAGQVYGRPELAAGFAGVERDATFGKKGDIKISGASNELIGITSDKEVSKNIRGVNFGAIMIFEKLEEAQHGAKKIKNPAAQLGLGEGMSYMGGTIQVKKGYTKTINKEGINQSKLLTEVLNASKDNNRKFLTIGSLVDGDDYDIDDFFKQFGDSEGRAVLGKQDDRIVHIKRHKGMKRFTLGLSEKSMETGRDRYHLKGQVLQDVDYSKLFSSLAKDTTLTINESSMLKKLEELGVRDIGEVFFNKDGFGGRIENTLLTTTAQLGKSAGYLRTQIHGGMKMLGLDEAAMDKALNTSMGSLDNADELLTEINDNQLGDFKSTLTNVDQVSAKQKSASTLGKFFQTIAKRAGDEGISADHFGMVMSYARNQASNKKFGLNLEYFERKIAAGLKDAGVVDVDPYLSKIEETAKRGVVIGAAFGTVGTPHTDLGRSVAKAEPRFANYLYSSLRSFWGMDSKEATGYVSSMITRMEGFESRAGGLMGMKLTQESLGKLDATNIKEQISGLSDVGKLTEEEVTELLDLGQGKEKEVVEKLSARKGGNILDLEKMGLSKEGLDRLYEFTGGKKEIFLPGEDTFQGFLGHEIRSSDEVIKVEAEYGRNITDLLSSLSSLKDAGTDEDEIEKSISGFTEVRKRLSKITGTAIRSTLSGKILGSGSYMGGGFTLGKKGVGATIFSDDLNVQKQIVDSLSEVVNKEMGYVAFMDQQAFLDGMGTYESAINKHLASQGKVSTKKETNKIMEETLEAFFTGMHRSKKEGISGTIQRNPLIGFSHIFASMGIYQYDFEKELKPLQFLRNVEKGEEFTPDYVEHLKKIRKSLNQDKVSEILKGVTGLEKLDERDAVYTRGQEVYAKRQEIKQERASIKGEEGYEKFVAERESLLNKRRDASKILEEPGGFIERRHGVFSGNLPQESNLNLLAEDVGAAQAKRHSKVALLQDQFSKIKKKAEPIIEQIKKFNKAGSTKTTEYSKKAEELKGLNEEAKIIDNKIHKINEQITAADKNKDVYGRAVLGGGDVSEGNIRRSLEREFTETIEDVGAYGRSVDEGRLTSSFRHFENKKEAIGFINEMGPFFGFNADNKTHLRSLEGFENEFLARKFSGKNVPLLDEYGNQTGSKLNPLEELAQPDNKGRSKINMNREQISQRIKEVRSGGASVVNLNLATKEELMQLKGVGPAVSEEIIAARKKGMVTEESLEPFLERISSRNRGRVRKVLNENSNYTLAPQATKIDAYDVIRREARGEEVKMSEVKDRASNFYSQREISQRATRDLNEMEKNPFRGKQKRRKALFEEIERLNQEEDEIKAQKQLIENAQKESIENEGDITIKDIDEKIMNNAPEVSGLDTDFQGNKTQPRAPGISRPLKILDDVLGREVKTGADLAELRLLKESGKLNEEQVSAYGGIYKDMLNKHLEKGEHGGGTVRFPQIDMSMQIEDVNTGKRTAFSGRMDFARFGIGDFDADPYQVFFDVDKTLKNKMKNQGIDAKKMYTYGAEFLTNMSLLGEGVEKLGKRMGASQMTVAQSIVDEYQKEQIVKGIGGLDVQVKAGMLGLAQSAADDTSGDFAAQFKKIQSGAALISVAQEVLGIKGKKLPIAANISREYLSALKTSFNTGKGDALKSFFQDKIFKGTLLENAEGNLKIDAKSIEFHNLGEGNATKKFREALGDVNLNVQEIFDSFDVMARNVKKYGFNDFTSNKALGRKLEGSSRFNSQQLFQLMNKGFSMEGGVITGELDEIESIFSKVDSARSAFSETVSRSKGLAGVIAGSLLASYAVGANSPSSSLEPGGKFSDSISKEALKAGQGLSNRALQQSFSREHGNVSPGKINGIDNFYERPINSGVSTVSLNRSIKMYGEAPSLSAAQTMGKHFVSAGGQASLTVNDNRRPIGNAYINKMMRD